MKYLFSLSIFLTAFFQLSYAQDMIEAPLIIEKELGDPVIFRVDWDNTYDFHFDAELSGLVFDDQESEFFLDSKGTKAGVYAVQMWLTDSTSKKLYQTQTIIRLYSVDNPPSIQLVQDTLIEDGFIELQQGTTYNLEFEASSASSAEEELLISYMLNERTAVNAFTGAEFNLIGNRLIVRWTPNQEQASRKYHDLEIIVIDAQDLVTRKTFHFKVEDIDLPPSFKYAIQPQYSVAPDRNLTIDFSVVDPDGDEFTYEARLSENVGMSQMNKNGQFSWTLNSKEVYLLRNDFPVELEVFVIDPVSLDTALSKQVRIFESRNNAAPEITRLTNISVKEGYPIKRRIFYSDNNHSFDQLKFSLDNAPDWLYLERKGEVLYLKSDTLAFDLVKADGIAVQYDVLLSVVDPQNASDQQFFTITVNEGINSDDVYEKYVDYMQSTDRILTGIRNKVNELEDRTERNEKLKKGFLYTSIVLGGYSGVASFFGEKTVARQAVPYTSAVLAVTSSVNALAFNQGDDITNIRVGLESLEKDLIRNRSFLQLFDIRSDHDEQLRNPEFSEKLKSYRQQLITEKIELRKLEQNYLQLNYVSKKIKRAERKGEENDLTWDFIR